MPLYFWAGNEHDPTRNGVSSNVAGTWGASAASRAQPERPGPAHPLHCQRPEEVLQQGWSMFWLSNAPTPKLTNSQVDHGPLDSSRQQVATETPSQKKRASTASNNLTSRSLPWDLATACNQLAVQVFHATKHPRMHACIIFSSEPSPRRVRSIGGRTVAAVQLVVNACSRNVGAGQFELEP